MSDNPEPYLPNIKIAGVTLFHKTQFAHRIGHSLRTVRRWMKSGTGPTYTKVGVRTYYSTKSIALWLGAHMEAEEQKRIDGPQPWRDATPPSIDPKKEGN